jgi:5S rRNA maturation endonuclease (ribonuclease M5)
VTGKRADVILLCDIRAKNRGEEIKKLFNLTMNGSYRVHLNSTKENRGVGIAIKRNIAHEIKGIKGTVPRDFLIYFSFHQSTPPWSLIIRL